jgi:hypothetical protein
MGEAETRVLKAVDGKHMQSRCSELFEICYERASPNWDSIEIEGVETLPAVHWKLLSIRNSVGQGTSISTIR